MLRVLRNRVACAHGLIMRSQCRSVDVSPSPCARWHRHMSHVPSDSCRVWLQASEVVRKFKGQSGARELLTRLPSCQGMLVVDLLPKSCLCTLGPASLQVKGFAVCNLLPVKPLRFPILLCWLAHAPRDEPCEHRQRKALGSAACALSVSQGTRSACTRALATRACA